MSRSGRVEGSRLAAKFERLREEGRAGLSAYLPFGYPTPKASPAAFDALVAGGVDWLELGIAYSDPSADGPTLQAASAQALREGATVAGALAEATRLRAKHPDLPLVAMTYANVVHRRGLGGFAAAAQAAGIDGLIVPDVPLEESGPWREACAAHGLAWIPLVAPTTPDGRMQAIAATGAGFLYVVANVGVTGQAGIGALATATLSRARTTTELPLAVGFGVRTPADVRALKAAGADAVIVGSHFVDVLREHGPGALRDEAARLRAAC